jgi:cell division initiation protein
MEMLTPQEVSQHAFAKASFGGYNMAMVDEFLDQLTEDYTNLYKENQVLKSKMKILVDKVEEYRATDDSMRKAFLVAQKSAEDIVAKAEAEREDLIRRAETEARDRVEEFRRELETEQGRLAAAQSATGAYVAKLRELCQHELAYLDGISQLAARTAAEQQADEAARPTPGMTEGAAPQDEPIDLKALHADVGDDESEEQDGGLYAELLELGITRRGESQQRPRRLAAEEQDEEAEEPTRRFDNLQFGKDYEIR